MFASSKRPLVTEKEPDVHKWLCIHLRGSHYDPYIELTRTHNFGGISPLAFGLMARCHFPYKHFPPLKDGSEPAEHPAVPFDCNPYADVRKWTDSEWSKAKHVLSGFSRWVVDVAGSFVKSTCCEIETCNPDSVCNACSSVAKDESFKRAVHKVREASATLYLSSLHLYLETSRSSTITQGAI